MVEFPAREAGYMRIEDNVYCTDFHAGEELFLDDTSYHFKWSYVNVSYFSNHYISLKIHWG